MLPFPRDSSFSIAVGRGFVAVDAEDPGGPPPTPGACSTPVFTAGPGGFTGTLTPAACLTPDTAPVAAGTNAVDIFTEPNRGWSGVIHETARIPVPGVRWVTLSGRTLVSLGEENVIDSFNLIARAPVFVLRRPAAGWQVLTSPQPRAFVQTAPGQDATDYGLDPASQLGATTAFLALELTLAAAKGAPALASLRALVPRGLGGGSRPRTIALKPSKRTAAVTLRRLHPSAALRRLVRRIAAHGGRTRWPCPSS